MKFNDLKASLLTSFEQGMSFAYGRKPGDVSDNESFNQSTIQDKKMDQAESPPEKAAFLLELAKYGQELDESRLTSNTKIFYGRRVQMKYVFRLAAWVMALIGFFQIPSWSFYCTDCTDWDNELVYPSSGILYCPYSLYIVICIFCVIALAYSIYLESGYESPRSNRTVLLRISVGILIIKCIEIILGIITLSLNRRPLFSASPLEAFFVILVEKRYTSKIWYLVASLPSFFMMIGLLGCAIISYTILGFLIFQKNSQEGILYFNTFGNGLWNMFMVFTASNWPSPMIPAYSQSRFYFIYFAIYIMAFNWGMLTVILGFVYALFNEQKKQVQENLDSVKVENIQKAYSILQDYQSKIEGMESMECLSYRVVMETVAIMYQTYEYINKQPEKVEIYELVHSMNISNKYQELISKDDFMKILSLCSTRTLRELRSKTHIDRLIQIRYKRGQTSLNGGLSNVTRFFRSLTHRNGQSMNSLDMGNNPSDVRDSNLSILSRYGSKRLFDGDSNNIDSQIGNDIRVRSLRIPDKGRDSKPNLENNEPSSISDSFISSSGNPRLTFRITSLWKWNNSETFLRTLSTFIQSVNYDIFVDGLITCLGIVYVSLEYINTALLTVIFILMMIECISKLIVKGFYRYRRSYRDSTDGLLTCSMIISYIVAESNMQSDSYYNSDYFASWVIVLIRIIFFIPRTIVVSQSLTTYRRRMRKAINHALLNAGHFYFLILVVIVFMYAFAVFGVLVYGGKISFQPSVTEQLASSAYGQSEYWPLNFNDIPSGMATLFVLLHVNNMHVTTSGFVATTNQTAEIFFTCWYVFGVLFLLNILIAYFLNDIVEYLRKSSGLPTDPKDKENLFDNSKQNQIAAESDVENRVSIGQFTETVVITPKKQDDRQSYSLHSTVLSPILEQLTTPRSSEVGRRRSAQTTATDGLSSSSNAVSELTPSTINPIARRRLMDEIQNLQESPFFAQSMFADDTMRKSLMENVKKAYDQNKNKRSSVIRDESKESPDHEYSTPIIRNNTPFAESMFTSRPSERESNAKASHEDGKSDTQPVGSKSSYFQSQCAGLYKNISEATSKFVGLVSLSDVPIEPHERAAIYLQLARQGSNISVRNSRLAFLSFRYTSKYYMIIRIAAIVLTILRYFERPAWTYGTSDWADTSIYPRSGIAYLNRDGLISCLFIPLLIIFVALVLEFIYIDHSFNQKAIKAPKMISNASTSSGIASNLLSHCFEFWETLKSLISLHIETVMRYILLFYTASQLIMLLMLSSNNRLVDERTINGWGRFNEFFLLWFHRRSLDKLIIYLQLTPFVLLIGASVIAVIMFFGLFGPYIVIKERDNTIDDQVSGYMGTYDDSIWSIFVAITSSSFPNQVVPAYRQDRSTFFFFFIFISVGSFCILNLLLLVLTIELQKKIQNLADARKAWRQLFVLEAFESLSLNSQDEFISKQDLILLIDELSMHYYDFFKHSPRWTLTQEMKSAMIDILDIDEDGKVSSSDFLFILEVSRLRLKNVYSNATDTITLQESFLYHREHRSNRLFRILEHVKGWYSWIMAPLISDMVIFILIIVSLSSTENVYQRNHQTVIISGFIYVIWSIDCISIATLHRLGFTTAPLTTRGNMAYRHKFDILLLILLTILLIGLILEVSIGPASLGNSTVASIFRFVECIRLLTIPRNISLFLPKPTIKRIVRIVKSIFKSIVSMLLAFYYIFYVFLICGVALYGGKIAISSADGNPYYSELLNSSYAQAGYWDLNFNDNISGFVTLFCALHVSDWDVITSGFSAVTSNGNARTFFSVWYFFGVLLLLNSVKTFILAGFVQGLLLNTSDDNAINPSQRINSVSDNLSDKLIGVLRSTGSFTRGVSLSPIHSEANIGNNPSMGKDSTNTRDSGRQISFEGNRPRQLSNAKPNYYASMADLKDLDESRRDMLRKRLQHLAFAVSPRADSFIADREVLEESRQASKSKLSDIMEGTLDFEEFHES